MDQAALDDLEELLIGADMGAKVAADVVAEIKRTRFNSDVTEEEIRGALAEEVVKILRRVSKPLTIRTDLKPHVILVAGVNGSGKTTTIGKLAQKYRARGFEGHAGRRRHVPRGRGRAAEDLGRTHRRTGDRQGHRRGRAGACL